MGVFSRSLLLLIVCIMLGDPGSFICRVDPNRHISCTGCPPGVPSCLGMYTVSVLSVDVDVDCTRSYP